MFYIIIVVYIKLYSMLFNTLYICIVCSISRDRELELKKMSIWKSGVASVRYATGPPTLNRRLFQRASSSERYLAFYARPRFRGYVRLYLHLEFRAGSPYGVSLHTNFLCLYSSGWTFNKTQKRKLTKIQWKKKKIK